MRSTSLTISSGLHVTAFVLAMVSLPWLKKDFVIPPPITVEFVEISKVTETDKAAPKPVPKEEKEIKKEEKPPPAAVNTSKEAVVPVPKTETKAEEKKAAKPVEDPNALPDKKAEKKPEKKEEKKEEAKPEPQRDFASVLKNLGVEKQKPLPALPDKNPDLNLNEPRVTEGQNAPLGAKMTISEEDALRRQLGNCWSVPFGARDAEDLAVEIFMVINPDRTLREARVVDQGRYRSDSFFRAAADSAIRAVRNPLCSPFALPPDKYDTWKTVTVTFNPKDMF